MNSQANIIYQIVGSLAQTAPATRSISGSAAPLIASTEARIPWLDRSTPALRHDATVHGTGIPFTPAPGSQTNTQPAESDVSIGPLLTGVTMMLLMRRHRR